MRFGDLNRGDVFNTVSGRWVKVSDNKAYVIMSGVHKLNDQFEFDADCDVVVLFTSTKQQNTLMTPELNSDTRIGERASWLTANNRTYFGVLKEWDNGTAIMLLDDGTEKAVSI